MLNVKFGE
jgi:hypothetical protein